MKEKNKEKKFGTPGQIALVNSVTGLRFLASFGIVGVFNALGGLAAGIYAGAFMLTDWIDGFLARKLKASTFFGSIFDGTTDKLFAILTLGLLLYVNPVVFAIPLLMEVGILAVQNKKMQKGLNVKSNMIGKIKTWVLSISMALSLAAVEFLDVKPFMEYIKTASLANIGNIKDSLALLGLTLPSFVFQALTLKSYSDELKVGKKEEQKQEETVDEKAEKTPEEKLSEINLRRQELQQEYTLLEKAKILKEKLFDPEYYQENKDKQIRTLTKELFTKKS